MFQVKKVLQTVISNSLQVSQWKDLEMCVLIHLESKSLAKYLKENPLAAHKQLIQSQTLPEQQHEDKCRVVLCLTHAAGWDTSQMKQ